MLLLLSQFFLLIQSAQAQSVAPSPSTPPQTPSTTVKPTSVVTAESLKPENEPKTGIHLTLSPVFINITTNPGTDVKSEFKVTNNNNIEEFLTLSLIKFRADQTGANITPIDIDETDEFSKWITFSEDQIKLAPNETKTIKFAISPPKDAALGYYYGIRVGRIREKNPGQREAIVSGSAVLSLLMEVRSPNAKKELSILDFSTSAPFYEYLPTQFRIKLKNSGNIHLVPFGDIFIDQGPRKEISVVKANEARSNILPQTERVLNVEWKEGFPIRVPKKVGESVVMDEKGKPVYTTQWDFNKIPSFRIGKYTANLIMVYDDGKKDVPLSATVSFWVIPWKILLGVLLVLILVLFGLKSIVSSIFRRR